MYLVTARALDWDRAGDVRRMHGYSATRDENMIGARCATRMRAIGRARRWTLHRVLRRRRPRLNRVSGAQLWLGHASAQLSCLRRPRMIAPAVASCSATSSPSSS